MPRQDGHQLTISTAREFAWCLYALTFILTAAWQHCGAYNDYGASDAPYLIRTFETYPLGGPIGRQSSTKSLEVRNAGPPQDLDIPSVGKATTAAPGYFRHLTTRIGNTTYRFKDGGFGCNNPSWETYTYVLALLTNGSKDMGPFVSIGTGVSHVDRLPSKQGRLRHKYAEFKAVTKGMPTMTQGAHENMERAANRDNKERFHYVRFDGVDCLGVIPMDEWKPNDRTGIALFTGKHKHSGRDTLRKIEDAVALYLAQEEVQQSLDRCAKILVQRRRRQTRDQSRWDRFAYASWCICLYDKCTERRHDTLENYRRHVLRIHPHVANRKQFDAETQNARRCWLYRDKNIRISNDNVTANDDYDGPDTPEVKPTSTFGSP